MNRRVSGSKSRWVSAGVGPVVVLLAGILAHQMGWIDLDGSREVRGRPGPIPGVEPRAVEPPILGGAAAIEAAHRDRRSDVWVESSGIVIRLFPDDRDGAPHQKFLLRLDGSSHTVLVAHNLDAAERVPVREGDHVRFRGEYEWTEKGGTIHFTHAPEFERREPGGWIEHRGKRFE